MRELMNGINFVDEAAFEQLFRKFFFRLDAYASKLVLSRDISRDIVQDSFISIWEKREGISLETFENYLFTAVRNRCLNYLKKKTLENKGLSHLKQTAWMEEIYRVDFLMDQPCELIETELRQQINEIMEQLPPRCREVFKLSREEGLKNREVAERLGINIKNVERHISAALSLFRKKFGAEMGILVFYSLFSSLL